MRNRRSIDKYDILCHICLMGRGNTNGRLWRIESLAARLKQDSLCTVKDLAQQHEVSERTIARDLVVMRDQGYPIETDRGRGGGVRLDRRWGVSRLNLAYPEAVDLLISISVAEQMKSPVFLANLGSVRRQIEASFSRDKHEQVKRLKSRILISATASTFVQASLTPLSKSVVQGLHQAFIDQKAVVIAYRREDGATSRRRIEPHYLLLQYPVWYVVAFDHLRNESRTFRFDRVITLEGEGDSFRLRPLSEFRQSLERHELLR